MNMRFDPEKNPRFAFNALGRATIEGVALQHDSRSGRGHIFRMTDGSGRVVYYTDEELSRLASMNRINWQPNYYVAEEVKKTAEERDKYLANLHGNVAERFTKRFAWVQACLDLEVKQKMKRSDASYAANMDTIRGVAIKLGKQDLSGRGVPIAMNIGSDPNPSTLRKWVKEFERSGAAGLVDGINRRRNISRAVGPEMIALMGTALKQGFLTNKDYKIKQAYEDLEGLVNDRNQKNSEEGKRLLVMPSQSTFNRFIKSLSPYQVALQREGADAARMKYRPIGQGLQGLTRACQRAELDEHIIDLKTIAAMGSELGMADMDRLLLGLDGKKVRWTLTVAICCTTKVILALKISRTAKQEASLETLQMMLMDKGEWIDHLGGTGLWNMFGLPEMIVTDCGSALASLAFRKACESLGITLMRSVAGVPECRGTIESLFHTMNLGLIPRLPGQTFSNVVERGDENPDDTAVLNLDDLCFALTRWIVDVYHNTEHSGLDGKTPLQAWNEAVEKYGVQPPPDMRAMRLVFGQALTRTLGRRGVRVFGVDYHSNALAAMMLKKPDRAVSVRWHPKDIGAVLVYIDGEWIEVPAVLDGYDGLPAQTWLTAARALQASRKRRTNFDQATILEAIKAIKVRAGDAMLTSNLLVEEWSDARIQSEEDGLFNHFHVSTDGITGRGANPNGVSITGKLPPAASAVRDAQNADTNQRGPGRDEDGDDEWGFEDA